MDVKKLLMSVDIVPEDVLRFLKEYLDFDGAKAAIVKLKNEFDLNPFDEDGDEYHSVFEEVHHNMALVRDAAIAVVICIEKGICGVVDDLDDPRKHALAKQALDDMIRLPWYMEAFDGMIIDLVLTFAVREAQRINWGEPMEDATLLSVPRSSASAVMYGFGAANVYRKIATDGPEGIKEKLLRAKQNLQLDASSELDSLIKKEKP